MTVARAALREAAAAALVAAGTDAGGNVFTARNWPIATDMLPVILLQVPAEAKEAWSAGSRCYTTKAQLEITARVAGGNPGEIEGRLDTLCGQIEQAILLDYALQTQLQRIGDVHTELMIDASGEIQIGEARMRFELEFVERFLPSGPPLLAVELLFQDPNGQPLASAEVDIPQS